MNRRQFLTSASAAGASLTCPFLGLHASAFSKVYFIDPGAGAGGGGSRLRPFGSFMELPSSLDGALILLRSGTAIRETLMLPAATRDCVIGMYGDGDRPVIDASDAIQPIWRDEGDGRYSFFHPTITALYADGRELLIVDSPLSLSDYTMAWDEVEQRIWIYLEGDSPEDHLVEASTRDFCVIGGKTTNVTIQDIEVRRASHNNLSLFNGCEDARVDNVKSTYAGSWSQNSRDGLHLKGHPWEAPSDGVIVTNCESSHNQNCGLEIGFLRDCHIAGNTLSGNGNGIELWNTIDGAHLLNNIIVGSGPRGSGFLGSPSHANAIWVNFTRSNTTYPTGDNKRIKIFNNVMADCNQAAIALQDGGHVSLRYNTIYRGGYNGGNNCGVLIEKRGPNETSLEMTRCIVHTGPPESSARFPIRHMPGASASLDFNVYYGGNPLNRPDFMYDGALYAFGNGAAALSAYSDASGQDGNSFIADPMFADPQMGDFSVGAASAAIGYGADLD